MERSRSVTPLNIALFIIVLLTLATIAYLYNKNGELTLARDTLQTEKIDLQSEKSVLLQNLDEASTTVAALSQELNLTAEELQEVEDDYRREKRKNEEFEEEYRVTIDTIRDLDKLSKTDKELLQKYSRVYFLNENYIPARLTKIDPDYILENRSKEQYFHASAYTFLKKMLDAAEKADVDLKVLSAYRSFDEQGELKGAYNQTYGTGANTFSADQGYSEHQLGTTLDLSDSKTAGAQLAFENTAAYEWLENNAHKYGFILSYPKNNNFYIFEPWHWRFVGVDLARDLKRDNAHFYDLEQRKIDEYLLNIFD